MYFFYIVSIVYTIIGSVLYHKMCKGTMYETDMLICIIAWPFYGILRIFMSTFDYKDVRRAMYGG